MDLVVIPLKENSPSRKSSCGLLHVVKPLKCSVVCEDFEELTGQVHMIGLNAFDDSQTLDISFRVDS